MDMDGLGRKPGLAKDKKVIRKAEELRRLSNVHFNSSTFGVMGSSDFTLKRIGPPVDKSIETLAAHMEEEDCIVDGGNEWYENIERRQEEVKKRGLLYLGMRVSWGEEGARNGPSLMPGGSYEAYNYIEDIIVKIAAQVGSGPCVTYIGKGGSDNFVKMVHNGIEYGDM